MLFWERYFGVFDSDLRASPPPPHMFSYGVPTWAAYIVETEKQKGRWWMRRVDKKWKDSFPMYDVLNMKNLRDMHAKLLDTIKSQAVNENFNLQTLIDSELCEHEKWDRTNIRSTSDCNEDNSVEHQAEITTQETMRLYLEIAWNGVKKKKSYLQELYFGPMNQSHLGRAITSRINQLQKILT